MNHQSLREGSTNSTVPGPLISPHLERYAAQEDAEVAEPDIVGSGKRACERLGDLRLFRRLGIRAVLQWAIAPTLLFHLPKYARNQRQAISASATSKTSRR